MVQIGSTYITRTGNGQICERMTVQAECAPAPNIVYLYNPRRSFVGQGVDLRDGKNYQFFIHYAQVEGEWKQTSFGTWELEAA